MSVKLCKRGEATVIRNSPFDLKGYKSDTLFKVIEGDWFGKLVYLQLDDRSDMPYFTDGVDYECFRLDEELEEVVEDTIKPAQSNLPDGWIPNKGKEPQFMLDGGVLDVLHNDGSITYQITDNNRDGDIRSSKSAYNWELGDYYALIKAWRPSKSSSNNDEQPTGLLIEVTRTSTYTVKIKGHEFTLTEEEYYDLRAKLEDIE